MFSEVRGQLSNSKSTFSEKVNDSLSIMEVSKIISTSINEVLL